MSDENYWMMQSMLQNRQATPMFSPSFTGSSIFPFSPYAQTPQVQTQTQAQTQPQLTVKEKLEIVNKKLDEFKGAKTQALESVAVQTAEGAQMVSKTQYDEQTGYYATDGANDGEISGWNKLANFGKGVANLFTDMFFDEKGEFSLKKTITTVAIGAAVATAAAVIPFAAPVLLGLAVVGGGVTLAKGAINAATAKTDEEAEKAWQDIGSGSVQTALSLAGVKATAKGAAVQLGETAPKWYQLSKSAKLIYQQSANEVAAAGGFANATNARWGQFKGTLDGIANKVTKSSHYHHKYENNIQYIDEQLGQATNSGHKRLLERLKAAYEAVYNAADDAALNKSKAELDKVSQLLQRYNDRYGTTDDLANSLNELTKISKSVTAENARRIRVSRLKADDYKGIINSLDEKINALQSKATRTEAENFELQLLRKTKGRYNTLYNAKTPEAQARALANLEKLNTEAIAEMNRARTATGTTAEQMAKYNEIVSSTQSNVFAADAVVKARTTSLLRAKEVLVSSSSTPEEIAAAKATINAYKPAVTQEQYLHAVDDIISELKLTKDLSMLEKFNAAKSSAWQKTKGGVSSTVSIIKKPNTLVTSSIMRETHPQSTWGVRLEKAADVDTSQQVNSLNTAIQTLDQMRANLEKGLDVDISTIM